MGKGERGGEEFFYEVIEYGRKDGEKGEGEREREIMQELI